MSTFNKKKLGKDKKLTATQRKALEKAREIRLPNLDLDDAFVASLVEKPLPKLELLDLSGNKIGPKGAKAIAQSKNLPALKALNLSENRLDVAGVAAIAKSKSLSGLQVLSLVSLTNAKPPSSWSEGEEGKFRPGDEMLAKLAESKTLTDLRKLDIYGIGHTSKGLRALAKAETFSNLRQLRVGAGDGAGSYKTAVLNAITKSPVLQNLVELRFEYGEVGVKGLSALAECTTGLAGGLRHLVLYDLDIDFLLASDDLSPMEAFSRSPLAQGLRELSLARNYLDNHGVKTLVSSPLPQLEVLDIGGCQFSAAGAKALAKTGKLPKLKRLNAGDPGKAATRTLKEAFAKVSFDYPLSPDVPAWDSLLPESLEPVDAEAVAARIAAAKKGAPKKAKSKKAPSKKAASKKAKTTDKAELPAVREGARRIRSRYDNSFCKGCKSKHIMKGDLIDWIPGGGSYCVEGAPSSAPEPKPELPLYVEVKPKTKRTIEELCAHLEAFAAAVAKVEGIDTFQSRIKPATDAQLRKLVDKAGVSLPKDLYEFLKRGCLLPNGAFDPDGKSGKQFASFGADFYDAASLHKNGLKLFRDMAKYNSYDKWLFEGGLPLSSEEPHYAIDSGGVYWVLYDGDPSLTAICPTFTDFLEHWLGSGCFYSHNFKAYWPLIKDLVPIAIPPKKNAWLKFYDSEYKTKHTRV